ncbi:septal ring lytic transglycosylase RlpA family protein [Altererythrobacter salegens]|uniref:Endolytic peptidoglycan transglycosylase RlpA n=1 Tax=Croceibacterium salegens TaxID=1737568 RepID=A0A6I4SXF2_9SPHN|nr:septal ring lytic transglycosylase RlpA family protein [Croceibacterium salegens]MXO58992.1 septal ring lytic transglycosylase RlpA family protein [Croceibacterium salegens]
MEIARALRASGVAAALLALSACGGGTKFRPVSDVPVRIGPPYTVRGVTYTPRAESNYDRLGYATWYGPESGNQTSNGERYQPDWISAAHTTLPLPSYVEVTDLDTGKRIIVRVNDRGPFSGRGRIIDLSRGAAEELGMLRKGVAPVRVRAVEPSKKDRERLREGKPAKEPGRISEGELRKLRERLAAGATSP